MFHFLRVWVRVRSCGQTQNRRADSAEVCDSPESPIVIYSLLCLTFHSPPSTPCTQIQSSPPLPLCTFLLCKGTPATYRTESIPLHTGWVPHWPSGLMKKPSSSPPSSLHPITYRKGIYLTLLRPPCRLYYPPSFFSSSPAAKRLAPLIWPSALIRRKWSVGQWGHHYPRPLSSTTPNVVRERDVLTPLTRWPQWRGDLDRVRDPRKNQAQFTSNLSRCRGQCAASR